MMLPFWINFAYTYARLMILSIYIQAKPWQYILCFLILICKPFFLPIPFPSWNIVLDFMVCLIVLNNSRQKLFIRFYYVLSIFFCFVVFSAVISSMFTLISPAFRHSNGYEYILMIFFLVGATLLKLCCQKPCKKSSYKVLALEVLLKMLILAAYMTLSYWFTALDESLFSLLVLFVVLLLSITLYAFHALNKQHVRIQVSHLEHKQHQEIKNAYERVVAFEHLYHDFAQIAYRLLKKKDYDELHVLLEEHVLPVLDMSDYRKEMKKIKDSLIREQVSLALNNAAILENVTVRFSINQTITLNKQDKKDVFKLLSEFFNNAFKSLEQQTNALLVVEFTQIAGNCQITVANSIEEEKAEQSLLQLTSLSKKKSSGYGRKLIADIVKQSLTMEHSESLNQDRFSGQTMFTQKICILGEAQ